MRHLTIGLLFTLGGLILPDAALGANCVCTGTHSYSGFLGQKKSEQCYTNANCTETSATYRDPIACDPAQLSGPHCYVWRFYLGTGWYCQHAGSHGLGGVTISCSVQTAVATPEPSDAVFVSADVGFDEDPGDAAVVAPPVTSPAPVISDPRIEYYY